jgi:hypothetical protein
MANEEWEMVLLVASGGKATTQDYFELPFISAISQ